MTTATTKPTTSQPQKSTNVRPYRKVPRWLRLLFENGSRWAPGPTAAVAARLFRTTRRSAPRAGEREVLDSARASKVAGMQVWSWGRGPTVLLVHGWNGRATQLGSFVAPLVARGYRVVAFDAFGHGASKGNRSSLPELADDIRQNVEQLGDVHAIVAHSLGAAATAFALAHGIRVERAVFISPPADPLEFLKTFATALGIADPVRKQVRKRIERRLGVKMEAMQVSAIAPSMQVPLLVVHDEDDKEVPVAAGRLIAAEWPGAELFVTRGLGHQRILRDEDVRDLVVQFIDQSEHLQRAA